MNAWAAATYLVQRGVPFRLAHEFVGKAVQLALDKGCQLQDLSLGELKDLHPAFDQDFYSCLSLESVLALHDVPGGTAPARVRQALGDAPPDSAVRPARRIWIAMVAAILLAFVLAAPAGYGLARFAMQLPDAWQQRFLFLGVGGNTGNLMPSAERVNDFDTSGIGI